MKNQTTPQTRLITVTEASRAYAICERILRRWIAEGAIAHHRIGGSIRLSLEDLDAFVAKHRVEPLN